MKKRCEYRHDWKATVEKSQIIAYFFSQHKMVPVAIEEPLYSLSTGVCGRPDWIGYIEGVNQWQKLS